MALWRLSEALWGAAGPDGHKAGQRLAALARAVFYGAVAYSVLKYALGLGAPAAGLIVFGIYSLCESRWRNV
jgi:hypothetical protein